MALIRRGIHRGAHVGEDQVAVFGRLTEAVQAAEDTGFDAIFMPDHIYDPGGVGLPRVRDVHGYRALAAVTSSTTLLTLASPITLRAPGLLAKAVTTLDVISGSRAVLSAGIGWDVAEQRHTGSSFPWVG